jgi:hypothetical protein
VPRCDPGIRGPRPVLVIAPREIKLFYAVNNGTRGIELQKYIPGNDREMQVVCVRARSEI